MQGDIMNIFMRYLSFLLFIGSCTTSGMAIKTALKKGKIAQPMQRTYTTGSTVDLKPTKPEIETTIQPSIDAPLTKPTHSLYYTWQEQPLYSPQQQPTSFYDIIVSLWNKWFSKPAKQTIQTPTSQKPIEVKLSESSHSLSETQALETALNIINNTRIQLNLNTPGLNLITCAHPGKEIPWLSTVKSLQHIEDYFVHKRKEILKSINLSDSEINNFLVTIEEERTNNIKNNYTKPTEQFKIVHDPKLRYLATVKEILTASGINPATICITTPLSAATLINEQWLKWTDGNKVINAIINFASAAKMAVSDITTAASVSRENANSPTFIIFYYAEKLTNLTNFTIAHEIGHIIRNHLGEIKLINQIFKNQKQKYASPAYTIDFDKAYQSLLALYEIEADLTVAMINPKISSLIHQEIMHEYYSDRKIMTLPFMTLKKPSVSQPMSAIHSSIQDKYDLIRRIKALHQSEGIQQSKPFEPDTKRE